MAERKALLDGIRTARSDLATIRMGPNKSEENVESQHECRRAYCLLDHIQT